MQRVWPAFLVVVLCAAPVAAQQPAAPGSGDEEARSLFEAGRAAFDAGRFQDALDRFREAYELSGRPGLLFNIGSAADRLRQDDVAIAAFEAYVQAEPDASNAAHVRARLEILRANRGAGPGPASSTGGDGAAIAGWVISLTGLAGLGVGWGFFVDLQGSVDGFRNTAPTQPGFLTLQGAMDDRETAVYFTGLASGAVMSIGLPLLLPAEEGIPWWSWVVGAVGLGAAAGGIAALVLEHGCVDQACTRREPLGALGGLLLGHAAPLLTVPLVYVVRSALGSDSSASVEVTTQSAMLRVGGRL